MASYSYWFRLTDFAERPFPQAVPNVWVQGPDGVFGPDGVLAPRRVPVIVTEGGSAVVDLVASTDTSPPVKYTLHCEWLSYDALSGRNTPAGWAQWEFTALAGGGDLRDMVSAPPSVIWVGPPWPDPIRPGIYIDRVTNDVGEVKP